MSKEVWIDGPRGEKIQIVNSKGEFVRPNRMGGEGYSTWQKRIENAMLKSGLYPRLNRAKGVQDRANQSKYKRISNELKIINEKLGKIEASKGTANEYSASLSIPSLTKRKDKLETQRLDVEQKSIGTSWDVFNDPTSPSYKDGGEEVGTMVNGELQPTRESSILANPEQYTSSAIRNAQKQDYSTGTGVVETPKGDNIDKTIITKTPKEKTEEQKPFINQVSSDVKPNRAALKSDIFTLDADGKALGVMTRGQRRLWEAANQDLLAKNKLKIGDRTYANRVGSG